MTRISFQQIPEQLMSCMMQTENHINSLDLLPANQLELMRYYVSQLNECAYCIDMHFKEAVAAGESEQRLYSTSVWRETHFYNESERAMLAWTESVTLLNDNDEQQQALFSDLTRHFSIEEAANLTLAVIQVNSWNRLSRSFGFEAGTYQVSQR